VIVSALGPGHGGQGARKGNWPECNASAECDGHAPRNGGRRLRPPHPAHHMATGTRQDCLLAPGSSRPGPGHGSAHCVAQGPSTSWFLRAGGRGAQRAASAECHRMRATPRRERIRDRRETQPALREWQHPRYRAAQRCLDSEPHERRASLRGCGCDQGETRRGGPEPRGRNVPGEANLGEADLRAESLKGRKQAQEGQSRTFGSRTGPADGSWKRAKPGGGATVFGPRLAGERKTSRP
jgi:hypothetical protein